MPATPSQPLASWWQLLHDAQACMHAPLSHYRTLQAQAAELLASGLMPAPASSGERPQKSRPKAAHRS